MSAITFILVFAACSVIITMETIIVLGALYSAKERDRKHRTKITSGVVVETCNAINKIIEDRTKKKKEEKVEDEFSNMMKDVFNKNEEVNENVEDI